MAKDGTLLEPPPIDPSKSMIENMLEITMIEPNLFTNTRPLWQPTGARGIFGGAIIAQCLAAAYKTVPKNFDVHSLHCYFLLAGASKFPFFYHVQIIRDGKSFATRTVEAKQHGKCIFTTTISFARENSGGTRILQHTLPFPEGIQKPKDDYKDNNAKNPFIFYHELNNDQKSKKIHEKKLKHWMKATGVISESGGHQAHLIALAYISDSHFIGTVTDIHDLKQNSGKEEKTSRLKLQHTRTRKNDLGNDELEVTGESEVEKHYTPFDLGMRVSLDHTIYFHSPRGFRADEWMLSDMLSPWSGMGRGLAIQHMFAADGTLIATCHQEGVVRFSEAKTSSGPKL